MAERAPNNPNKLPEKGKNRLELLEEDVTRLIENVHNHRTQESEHPQRHILMAEIREDVIDLFRRLQLPKVEDTLRQLEDRLNHGQHDLVVEFLRGLSRLQYEDFNQEFLKLQAIPIVLIDDTSTRDPIKLGHPVINYITDNTDTTN